MLRPLENTDIDRLGQLWLHLACTHHPSLPVAFWQSRLSPVLRRLSRDMEARKADSAGLRCWVYANPTDNLPEGLVAISANDEIQAVFVAPPQQRQGIGSELLAQAKFNRAQLEVRVLEENLRGRFFLQQHGFEEAARSYCQDARQDELVMLCRAA